MRRAKVESGAAATLPRELQQMWLQLVRTKWSSMVLIPTDPGTSAQPVSSAITEMARFYALGELGFKVISAEGATLQDGARIAKEVVASVSNGSRVVVAVDFPMQNGGAMPVIMAAEAAILLVRLGASDLESARSIIQIVGRERVMGSIAIH